MAKAKIVSPEPQTATGGEVATATVEPRIVAAAAQFTGHGVLGQKSLASQLVEQAMTEAVLKALADGVSIHDSEAILRYKQAARSAVLANLYG